MEIFLVIICYGMLCYAFGIVMGRNIAKDDHRAKGKEGLVDEYSEKRAEIVDAQYEEVEDVSVTDLIQSEEDDIIDLTDIVFEIRTPIPERKHPWGTVLMEASFRTPIPERKHPWGTVLMEAS